MIEIKTYGGKVLYTAEDASDIREALQEARKAGAYLTDANLAGAYLTGAYLTGANLAGAYLTGAYLTGANLAGAKLTGALGYVRIHVAALAKLIDARKQA